MARMPVRTAAEGELIMLSKTKRFANKEEEDLGQNPGFTFMAGFIIGTVYGIVMFWLVI